MKTKPYCLQKIKVKKLKCRLLQFLFGALRVKGIGMHVSFAIIFNYTMDCFAFQNLINPAHGSRINFFCLSLVNMTGTSEQKYEGVSKSFEPQAFSPFR